MHNIHCYAMLTVFKVRLAPRPTAGLRECLLKKRPREGISKHR